MKKYIVYYRPLNRHGEVRHGDLEKCWVYARNEEEAEFRARDDNWDVGVIVDVMQID